MTADTLVVLLAGRPAGTVRQDSRGLMTFCYDDAYQGSPLSLSMPVTNRVYRDGVVRPYLLGLLPDSEWQRRAIALEHGVRASNPMELLSCIGLDCPGAVQLCAPDMTDAALSRAPEHRELADHEIALRLAALRSGDNSSWMGMEERWSLGGSQGKFALAQMGEKWLECRGSSPTTHIFKNGIAGMRLEALNEFVCMTCAAYCGLAAAHVDYRLFEDEPALIVERFDRVRGQDGTVVRLHQEDLCQALSCPPERKYTADGGPTVRDVLMLLGGTSESQSNLRLFTQQLFFNCIIGAPDAHAKNYSLILGSQGLAVLSPLYDVASGLAYERFRPKGKLAMSIGGENRVGRVGSGAIRRYAGGNDPTIAALFEKNDISAEACLSVMAELATRVPKALEQAFDDYATLPGADELRDRLLPSISENCARTLALL